MKFTIGTPGVDDYDILLDEMSGMRINSEETSTVPLAQFWKNTQNVIWFLESKIEIAVPDPLLCFEYPVKPQVGKNRCSMTDLMILSQKNKIAIEAKYKEYVDAWASTVETVAKWTEKNAVNKRDNKRNVANAWWKMIRPFSKSKINEVPQDIGYQFLHRTASACYGCDTQRKAIVIYQVFYKPETKYHEKLAELEDKLRRWLSLIDPNEYLRFYIWKIEAVPSTDTKFEKRNSKTEPCPFNELKKKSIYTFNGYGTIYPLYGKES